MRDGEVVKLLLCGWREGGKEKGRLREAVSGIVSMFLAVQCSAVQCSRCGVGRMEEEVDGGWLGSQVKETGAAPLSITSRVGAPSLFNGSYCQSNMWAYRHPRLSSQHRYLPACLPVRLSEEDGGGGRAERVRGGGCGGQGRGGGGGREQQERSRAKDRSGAHCGHMTGWMDGCTRCWHCPWCALHQ